MLRHKLAFRAACPFFLIGLLGVSAAPGQEIHFSPEERLDAIDVQLVGDAKQSIDFASYALTDPVIIDALNAAERRGVAIRIVLDPRERHDFVKLGDLSDNVRIKRGGPYMHLKAYAIDGERLRTGSCRRELARFSTTSPAAGLLPQAFKDERRPNAPRRTRCRLASSDGVDDNGFGGEAGAGAQQPLQLPALARGLRSGSSSTKAGGPSRTPVRLLGGFCRLHARGVEVFDGRSFSGRPLLGNPLPSDLASGGFRRRHVVFVPQGRWRLRWASCGFASLLRLVLALAATAGLCADPSDAPTEVDAAVVLAADVSRSIDDGEFALERRGYAEAIQSQKLLNAISTGPHGAIALAYVEWAGESEQMIVVDWAVIRNAADAHAFATSLSGAPRSFVGRTAIGSAINFALALFSEVKFATDRRVIDVSGDGTSNQRSPVTAARDAAVGAGATINGLTIFNAGPRRWGCCGVPTDWFAMPAIGGEKPTMSVFAEDTIMIHSASKNKDAAAEFVNWVVSPEAGSKKLDIDKPYPSNVSADLSALPEMEQRLAKSMADAGSFTFMHVDHATPPAISDKFLDGVQGVLAGALTPEEAMTLTENEAIRVRGKV